MSTTLLAIVMDCENYLGLSPAHPAIPRKTFRRAEVDRLKAAMAEKPSLHTIDNLRLALAYSRRKRLSLKSAVGLIYRIPAALELANVDKPVSDLAAQVAAAIRWEKDRNDDVSLRWIHQLARASGPGLADVLEDWKAASRG